MAEVAADLATTIQTAHINRNPSPSHDINPSTAASKKEPVSPATSRASSFSQSTIPLPSLHPAPRRANLPPLPDLRLEQTYLASIRNAESKTAVAWITLRDHVLFPLVQGTLWSLALQGWRFWNRGVKLQGQGMGAKARRWWWGVNNWKVPEDHQA